jgi:Cyclic nucleotide-binding domain
MFLKHQVVAQDTVLWSVNDQAKFCLFLYSGSMQYETPAHKDKTVLPGMFVGDFHAMFAVEDCKTRLVASEDCEILKIDTEDLMIFLSRNPGLKVLLMGTYIVA